MGSSINRPRVTYAKVPDEALKHKWNHLDRLRKARQAAAEQEARNAQRLNIDCSHISPVRVADRYAAGRRPQRGPGGKR